MSKSQRIRQAFSNLSELRNPMITGRQRINKKYLMQGKKAVKDAIKAGKKTGEPFSKSQLADIAMQKTDIPEIAAEKRGGGKKLPPNLGPSDREVATKKALMKQHSSTDHTREGIKTLFESVLNEILKNPRRRGDLSAKPTELTRTPVPYPELVRTSRKLRADLRTAKEGGLRALAGLAGEKPDPKELADEDKRSVRSSVAQAHASLSGSHKLGQTDAATRRLLRLPPAQRPTTAQSRDLVAQQDREDASTDYYREGLKALFESVIEEVSKRAMQRQANKDYWAGEGKDFKGAGRLLANFTKKFKAKQPKQPEKSPFRTPDPNDPNDWGIDPIPDENVNVGGKSSKGPDQSDEKMRSPHFN